MAYLTNRNAPISGLANLLAMRGRRGDTELVHMSKPEIDMMERMGKMTSNPATGLPEAFSLEDEMEGLVSLMEMPNAKDAMKDLMEYGKEKLKTLTMKDIEKEMPAPQQQPMPIQRPMPQPQQGAMTNLRSGGLASFGQHIQRQLMEKAREESGGDIDPFLDEVEGMAEERFGIEFNGGGIGGQQPMMPPSIQPRPMTPNLGQPRPMPFPRPNVIGPAVDRFPIGVQPYQPKPLGSQDPGRILEIRQNMKDSAKIFKEAIDKLRSGQSQYKDGGIIGLAEGMRPKDYFEGQIYDDRGDGMSDDIDFKVEGDPVIKGAKLSADEYVLPADLVAMLGNGSSDAGAKKLDAFTKEMRMKAFGTTEQQKPINATKELKDMV
jgi:hypothetical protein